MLKCFPLLWGGSRATDGEGKVSPLSSRVAGHPLLPTVACPGLGPVMQGLHQKLGTFV